MSDDLQKSAPIRFRQKDEFIEGILDANLMARNYDLRCYEPSEFMALFVEHYFISRRLPEFDPTYIGHDVLSQPVVTLFIDSNGMRFVGPTTHMRTLVAAEQPMYVGAQFKPGGFYPFWKQSASRLVEQTIPAETLVPALKEETNSKLLQQENDLILAAIDRALRAAQPIYDSNIGFVNNIIAFVENDSQTTVATVAAHFNTSERALQHLFQTYVGVGLKWAIMRARFVKVTQLLRMQPRPDWGVISADLGYSHQSHFINDFKRLVGMSPSQFMKQLEETRRN